MQPTSAITQLVLKTGLPGLWMLESADGYVATHITQSNSLRDVRDTMMTMAYFMRSNNSCARGLLALTNSKLSFNRLAQEFNRLRSVLHPDIGHHLNFVIIKPHADRWQFSYLREPDADPLFEQALNHLLCLHNAAPVRPSGLPARQIAMSVITEMLMQSGRTESIQRIVQESGVSHPTVKAVSQDLAAKGLLEPSQPAVGMAIRPPSAQQWITIANEHALSRKTTLYCDPTGASTPKRLANRLAALQESETLPTSIGISGVMGAAHHFAYLDITSAPRLDLCAPESADHIAQQLDAGLVRADSHSARYLKPVLAIHRTRICNLSAPSGVVPLPIVAGWLDCLADILEMGLAREGHEMALYMAKHVSEQYVRNNFSERRSS